MQFEKGSKLMRNTNKWWMREAPGQTKHHKQIKCVFVSGLISMTLKYPAKLKCSELRKILRKKRKQIKSCKEISKFFSLDSDMAKMDENTQLLQCAEYIFNVKKFCKTCIDAICLLSRKPRSNHKEWKIVINWFESKLAPLYKILPKN